MRKILTDINTEDVIAAQKNVAKLSEVVEKSLLLEFESVVVDLMELHDDERFLKETKVG